VIGLYVSDTFEILVPSDSSPYRRFTESQGISRMINKIVSLVRSRLMILAILSLLPWLTISCVTRSDVQTYP
jgi:hypothetical protein